MRKLFLVLLLVTSSLYAETKGPWLGNLYEFEGTLFQDYTESSRVDTSHGKVHKHLHANRTEAALSFMPLEDLCLSLEADFAETQKKSYGFDAVKGTIQYQWLDDLKDDDVSLTTGFTASLSPHSRIRDLSSENHGHFEGQLEFSVGREFWQHKKDRWSAWAQGFAGIADAGSPWLGGELHLEKAFYGRHFASCFFRTEKCLSDGKLRSLKEFNSWSQIGYQFEEVGLRYFYKKYGLGSCVIEVTRRVHAHFCPSNSWTLRVGIIFPFSPW